MSGLLQPQAIMDQRSSRQTISSYAHRTAGHKALKVPEIKYKILRVKRQISQVEGERKTIGYNVYEGRGNLLCENVQVMRGADLIPHHETNIFHKEKMGNFKPTSATLP